MTVPSAGGRPAMTPRTDVDSQTVMSSRATALGSSWNRHYGHFVDNRVPGPESNATPVAALTRWLRTGVLPDALAPVAPCLMCVHCAAALDGATCLLKKRPACNLAG